MSLLARFLVFLHPLSAVALLAAAVLGYGAARGSSLFVLHTQTGFFIALLVGFTMAMTIFYLAGMGVEMRQAASGRASLNPFLEQASRVRKRLAPMLGFALVTAMAAAILGGGAHTEMLPSWPHETLALSAVLLNLVLAWKAPTAIRAYESIVRKVEAGLDG